MKCCLVDNEVESDDTGQSMFNGRVRCRGRRISVEETRGNTVIGLVLLRGILLTREGLLERDIVIKHPNWSWKETHNGGRLEGRYGFFTKN